MGRLRYTFGTQLPEGFDSWFLRATAHDASERWQRAGEAAVELITILGGVPDARASLPSYDATVLATTGAGGAGSWRMSLASTWIG